MVLRPILLYGLITFISLLYEYSSCSTIKVAEAAKVVENTQRDLNIALANELALIFEKLQIDTNDVIDAAVPNGTLLRFVLV